MPVERLKVILLKDRKRQPLSIFCCEDIPKMSSIVKSNPLTKNDLFEQSLTRITSRYSECMTWIKTFHAFCSI